VAQPPPQSPGWYPGAPGLEVWWDGQRWTEQTRPAQHHQTGATQHPGLPGDVAVPTAPRPGNTASTRTVAILVAGAMSVIGLLMQFQTVSLLTGAGLLWIGAALAAGGVVAAFATKVRTLVKVVTVLILAFCVVNVAYVEHQLDQRRHEIQQILDN